VEEDEPVDADAALHERPAEWLQRLIRFDTTNPPPMPLLLPAVSDARFFARLGIQTYGFLPMQLPSDLRFMDLIHAEDERIRSRAWISAPPPSVACSSGWARRLSSV
jgi:acetylornithine deacetylase/succinyl-diaminopimelate desuccinylase-like protein